MLHHGTIIDIETVVTANIETVVGIKKIFGGRYVDLDFRKDIVTAPKDIKTLPTSQIDFARTA